MTQKVSKAYVTLITHKNYLPGVLTLNYALLALKHSFPLIVMYTPQTPDLDIILDALNARNIQSIEVDYLFSDKMYPNDTRFNDCWTKLQVFKLTQFERIVMLDSDMVLLQNIDTLMDVEFGDNVFAAAHACVCNPYNKSHYPSDWVPQNCAYSEPNNVLRYSSESNPDSHATITKVSTDVANVFGPSCNQGLQMCNGGLLVIEPRKIYYDAIIEALYSHKAKTYDFADQSLLSDIFQGKWLGLSYTFNALKTLSSVHRDMWDINRVKVIHYIISPKPWNVDSTYIDDTDTFKYWWSVNEERQLYEMRLGIDDYIG